MSEILFHRESFVASQGDGKGNPDIYQIFRVFQLAAVRHAEELGIGKSFYIPNRLLFVLCRMKLVLSGSIVAGKKYRLTTFALPPERIQFYRDAYIEDESGEVVGRLTALWVLISALNRRITLTDGLKKQLEPLAEKMKTLRPVLGERLSDLDEEEETEACFSHVVSQEDIDENGHMNNTVYIRLVQEAGFDYPVKTFEIDFEKECMLSETLTIYKGKEGYYSGVKDGHLSFKCRVGK